MTNVIQNVIGMGRSLLTRRAGLVLASVVGLGTLSAGQASARDHGFIDFVVAAPVPVANVGQVWVDPVYQTVCDHVWVEPVYQTVCNRQFVPDHTEVRDIPHPYRPWIVDRQSVLIPAHYEDVTQQVVVTPGHYEDVQRQVLVTAGHWEETACGPVTVVPEIGFNFILGDHHDHDHYDDHHDRDWDHYHHGR